MTAERTLVAEIRGGRGDAIEEVGTTTSYAALLDGASRLAAALRRLGAGPGSVVPIQGTACRTTVTQIVAVLSTGAAYAPLDSRTPDRAVAGFARVCGASIVLGERRHSAHGVHWLRTADVLADRAAMPAVSAVVPDDTAYVIATSGTSGAPKGVVVPESAVTAYLAWAMAEYDVDCGYGAPLFTSLGFDLTVTSLLGPLVCGRRLVVLDPIRWPLDVATSPGSFDDASFAKLTPSQLDILCQVMAELSVRSRVPTLVVGGEAMRGQSLTRWRTRFPEARIVNEYGPSEATVGCCRFTVPDDFTGDQVPIGTPPPGVTLHLRPIPSEEHGELIIEGDQVATGYLVGPGELVPFASHGGRRRYASGDQASLGRDGLFTYHGRIGREVKVNGFRVNLSALESRLATYPGVVNAAVDQISEGLTAHVVVTNTEVTPTVLRRHLLELFPVYALPAAITVSQGIRTTERGKLAVALPATSQECVS